MEGTGGKPQGPEIVRNAKTIFIDSQTIYLRAKLLEDELTKSAEFKSMGLRFVRTKAEADLIVELTLPFLTWTWTYNVKPQSGGPVLAGGKIREALASTASPQIAQEITARLMALRAGR